MHNAFFSKSNKVSKALFLGLTFILLLGIGVSLYKDFNISSDEQIERSNGVISLLYIGDLFKIGRITSEPDMASHRYLGSLDQWKDRDYPVGFNLPAVLIEKLLKLNDERKIYFLRHLLTYLTCLLGSYAIFRLAERRFSDWRIGLLALIFFTLSPRFFAESFYNSKDLVFLAFFALGMNSMIEFILHPRVKTALLFSLVTALAINIRIMAIILPIVTLTVIYLQVLRKERNFFESIQYYGIYLLFGSILTIAFWPWLWANPWLRFVEAFSNMAKFRWDGDMLYLGSLVRSSNLPWHYIPVWIGITTPFLYLILSAIGMVAVLKNLLNCGSRLWQTNADLQDLIFLGLFIAPIAAVILMKSILYDGWRQMYFIYPAFLLIAIRGWVLVWSWTQQQTRGQKIYQAFIATVLCVSLSSTALWMIQSHPIQNIYFNFLAGKNWKDNFDVDYWGLSNRLALEYIADHDPRPLINIDQGSFSNPGLALKIISPERRARIKLLERNDCCIKGDYLITNFRLDKANYSQYPNLSLFHSIEVGNEPIMAIYKRD